IDLGGFAQYVHRQDRRKQTQVGFNLSVPHLHEKAQRHLPGVQNVRVNLGIGLLQDELGVVEMGITTDGELLLKMEAAHPSNFYTLVEPGAAPAPQTDNPQKRLRNGPMTLWIDGVNLQNRALQSWFSTKFKDLTG